MKKDLQHKITLVSYLALNSDYHFNQNFLYKLSIYVYTYMCVLSSSHLVLWFSYCRNYHYFHIPCTFAMRFIFSFLKQSNNSSEHFSAILTFSFSLLQHTNQVQQQFSTECTGKSDSQGHFLIENEKKNFCKVMT